MKKSKSQNSGSSSRQPRNTSATSSGSTKPNSSLSNIASQLSSLLDAHPGYPNLCNSSQSRESSENTIVANEPNHLKTSIYPHNDLERIQQQLNASKQIRVASSALPPPPSQHLTPLLPSIPLNIQTSSSPLAHSFLSHRNDYSQVQETQLIEKESQITADLIDPVLVSHDSLSQPSSRQATPITYTPQQHIHTGISTNRIQSLDHNMLSPAFISSPLGPGPSYFTTPPPPTF